MIAEDAGAQRHRVPRRNGPVGPNLQGQLVKVGQILHAGVLHGVVDLFHRCVNRVHRDDADDGLGGLIALCRHVAAPMGQGELHVQHGLRPQGGNGVLGVEDLHLAVGLDVTCRDHPLAGGFDVHGLGAFAVQLGDDALDVQDDFGYVLFHTGDRAELMLYPCNLDAGDCSSGQRGQQNPAKRVA